MSLSSPKTQVPNELMKVEKEEFNVGVKFMAKSLPISASNSFGRQTPVFPTPSPFSVSIASTGWSSKPRINLFSLLLRLFAFLFSFISALSLVIISPGAKNRNFGEISELLYCFIVTMLAFAYSLFQLFKGILEIAERGVLMSDMVSDYASFIIDQLLVYLMVSSSSAAISAIKRIEETSPLKEASIISVTFSFATFLVMAICALLSGYKLCKRIIW